jgi:polyhydroxybutyrate depolymerase
MTMNIAELFLALSLATLQPTPAAADDACATPVLGTGGPAQGTTCHAIGIDGVERTYRLYVPANAATRPSLPLILVLHGGGGAGVGMIGLTKGSFHTLADREGALIAYPDALNNNWNDGRDDFQSKSHTARVDDVGFLRALVKDLRQRFPVDPTRVYATGASNGGMMSIRLACEAADLFAAVAPVIGSLPAGLADSCRPARPIGVVMMNGTEDRLVPYDGGVVLQRRGSVLGVEDTARRFAAANGCAAQPVTETLPDRDSEDGTQATRIAYSGCAVGGGMVLYRVEGGGHTWPMGAPYAPRLAGRVSQEIDGTAVIWDFFQRYRR